MSGGQLGVVIEALPHELLTIGRGDRSLVDRRLDVLAQEDRRRFGQDHLGAQMEGR